MRIFVSPEANPLYRLLLTNAKSSVHNVYPQNTSTTTQPLMDGVDTANVAFLYPYVFAADVIVNVPERVRIRAKNVNDAEVRRNEGLDVFPTKHPVSCP